MLKVIKLAFSFFLILFGFATIARAETVYEIRLQDDTINPITVEYISEAIDKATADNAQCLIITLDTPGGLLASTRSIVRKILSSDIPVVVYIAPSGARAGSAGVFITYASHIAAMAPTTNIGAAHPVQMGGPNRRDSWSEEPESEKGQESSDSTAQKDAEKDDDPMSSKILNDTVAFIKTMAKQRNRNAEWAVKSVTESSSITESEAKEIGVVEIIASDTQDLLVKLDGRTVDIKGKPVTLNTKEATVKVVEMDQRQKFFNILANPNIAYILLILGFYGLLYEITHPGFGIPGILGIIFMVLAFFSMQALPTNYAALALIGLGIFLLIAEAITPGFGLFAVGGLVSLILGSMLLFDSPVPIMRVSLSVIFSATAATAGITLLLVGAVIRTHRKRAKGGQEGLIGEKGIVRSSISKEHEGKVFVQGELWNAVADTSIPKGAKIQVESIDGLTLKVKKA